MALSLIIFEPVAPSETLFEIKVMLPVEVMERAVKVLVLIF